MYHTLSELYSNHLASHQKKSVNLRGTMFACVTPTDILLYPEEALFLVERGSMVLHDHIVAEKLSGAVDRVAKGVLDGKKHLGEDLNVCLGTVGSLSLQECYAVLLGPGRCTLAQYQVYAYLRRAGYVVFRHDPVLVSKLTADSTNVGVDGSASNAASVIASPVGLPNLSLPTTLLTKWGSIHRWIVPIFFVLLKSGGRFRWRRAMKSHVTMRKFILYSSRAVWKWLFARVSMICWSVLWHRSKVQFSSDDFRLYSQQSVSAPKVKTELVPDFDVYHPNSNFKKSTRSVPDIYLSVFSGDDAVPHGKDLESLFKLARASGPIKRPLIKVAIVEQGRMSFLGLNDTLVDPLDEETKYQGKKRK
ncbi:hypothetical protein BCR33DRAFT_736175 [Rhizoclosmatium globosum]|uniref:Uncharacterized protein n=1 Tax=Rhizoclosmatium globosum TaxID=329046 RepID=A0A1Y2CK16_9FUNG|nr:hypothetical protein BCR33DRAFT_736175 [Rhizoclosmatium globosum]|eukprot:ORY47353.1 hypothetical protein BCR33DRAFT_736175 [Rhizoclosmatium globosum]